MKQTGDVLYVPRGGTNHDKIGMGPIERDDQWGPLALRDGSLQNENNGAMKLVRDDELFFELFDPYGAIFYNIGTVAVINAIWPCW
eukprot:jgi/Picsp_1/5822/NSC_03181-R1_---NA---